MLMGDRMKILIIIGAAVVLFIVYFVYKNYDKRLPVVQTAKQIQFLELKDVMEQLLKGELEYDFFGITSDGVDCIYFSNSKEGINIEFEVMSLEQKEFVEKLKGFANENGFSVTQMTYGNKPNYKRLKIAPVYKIELRGDSQKATEVGIEIMKKVFKRNKLTQFDVVP
jgi:hypothetical protein